MEEKIRQMINEFIDEIENEDEEFKEGMLRAYTKVLENLYRVSLD